MSRILIVDDEDSILNALRRLLSLTPCQGGSKTYRLSVDTFNVDTEPVNALLRAALRELTP
jgi:hypothetical protein